MLIYNCAVENNLQHMQETEYISQILAQLGLSKKEIDVFIAVTIIGQATVKNIARETSITRTHIYDIAESLLQKGLVSVAELKGMKHYSAVNHAGLMAYISMQKKELDSIEKKLTDSESAFVALQHGIEEATSVEFFQGLDGMASVYEEIRRDLKKMKAPMELITTWPVERLEAAYPGFYQKEVYFNIPGLVKRDIIYESPMADLYIKRYADGPADHDYRIWPSEKGEFPTDGLCWMDNVAFTDVSGHPSSIIIRSKAVADTFRMFFNQMWESLS